MITKETSNSKEHLANYILRLLQKRVSYKSVQYNSLQLSTRSNMLEVYFELNRGQPKNNKMSHRKPNSTYSQSLINEQENSSSNYSFERQRPNDCYTSKGTITNLVKKSSFTYGLEGYNEPFTFTSKVGLRQKIKGGFIQHIYKFHGLQMSNNPNIPSSLYCLMTLNCLPFLSKKKKKKIKSFKKSHFWSHFLKKIC